VQDDAADFDKDSFVEHAFNEEQVATILGRYHEIELANKNGRHKEAHTQMKEFDKQFHNALTRTVPCSTGPGLRDMLFYNNTATANNAMDFQEAVLRNMRAQKEDLPAMADNGDLGAAAACANCNQQDRQCTIVELPDALLGPAHVAKLLVGECQTRRTAAALEASPYQLNAEQLQVLAIYVHALEKGFACREKKEEPWVNPASVLLTIVLAAAFAIILACFVLQPDQFRPM
jgi:hypothetical protein